MGKIYKFWILLMSILGGFSLSYFILLTICLGVSNGFNYFWLALGCVCALLILGIALSSRHGRIPPKWVTIPVELLVGLGFLLFIIIEAIIIHGGYRRPPEHADYLIVLGARVNGTQPSLILKYRIQAAVEYLQDNPDTLVIASGGKGSDEKISEAECIRQELIRLGIDEERILLEDQSTSTVENLAYSKELIRTAKHTSGVTDISQVQIVLTTTDFHLYRAIHLAEQMGYAQVYGNPARSVWWLIPTNYTREFFAVMKDVVLGSLHS